MKRLSEAPLIREMQITAMSRPSMLPLIRQANTGRRVKPGLEVRELVLILQIECILLSDPAALLWGHPRTFAHSPCEDRPGVPWRKPRR